MTNKVVFLLKAVNAASTASVEELSVEPDTCKKSAKQLQRENTYIFFDQPTQKSTSPDNAVEEVRDYIKLVEPKTYPFALAFWKAHEIRLPGLAILAKKYLSVQAAEAGVERMFSLSGHIFSNKRRRLGRKVFAELTYLKLNEEFLE